MHSENELERLKALPYHIEMLPDEDGSFPFLICQGAQGAGEMISDAQRMWLQTVLEDDIVVPETRSAEA